MIHCMKKAQAALVQRNWKKQGNPDTSVMRVLIYCWFVFSFLTLGLLGLLAACTSSSDRPEWIRNGVTTKQDVIARYGQPDVVMAAPGGDTAIYHPTASAPRLEISTVQAAPSGQTTTRMQPMGATERDREGTVFLKNELRIHYDARDVVQGLSSP